ncbi:MAG: peptide chain release factor N(5)-glutamine methyltransferase [Pseudomonadota bacterium]
MNRTLGDCLAQATADLAAAGIDAAPREARMILAHALKLPQGRIILELGKRVGEEVSDDIDGMIARRLMREPLAYILGKRAFYNHEYRVTRDVLDPRPETETLVRAALEVPFDHVLDLGTGSGCILISLLAARQRAAGIGTDISPEALAIAAENAEAQGLGHRAMFLESDWFDAVEGRYDLIVSNPPYVSRDEMTGLAPELAFEPRQALTDEGDGLSAYRTIVPAARAYLRPGAQLMVEIGWQQGDTVATLFREAGFEQVTVLPDLDGRDRVVCGFCAS